MDQGARGAKTCAPDGFRLYRISGRTSLVHDQVMQLDCGEGKEHICVCHWYAYRVRLTR